MRVCVTGGRGFLGRHFVHRLRREGHEVISLIRPGSPKKEDFEHELDFVDFEAVQDALKTANPTHIVYLASTTSPGRRIDNFDEMFRSEVLPMIQFARATPTSIQAAVFSGSCEEYGNAAPPFVEDQAQVCMSSYGWGKISAFHAVQYTLTLRRVPWIWVRPFLLYGPDHSANLFAPSIVRTVVTGGEMDLSPGDQTRDFIYIHDCVEMLMQILNNPHPALGGALNLCSGTPRTLKFFGQELLNLSDRDAKLNWGALPYREFEAMEFFGSIEKFEKIYGKFKYTDFHESLKTTLADAKKRYSKTRDQ